MSEALSRYLSQFEQILEQDVYGLSQAEKEPMLLKILNLLEQHHLASCSQYRNISQTLEHQASTLAELPYLAVRLFKHLELKSIGHPAVFKTLQSSGTTGQQTAKILLDKETSARQSKVLVKIMQQTLGKQRLPMLIIDSPSVLKNTSQFSARAAGIQGLAFFGRDHSYALDENMQPNFATIDSFCDKYADQPVLVFGFTFMLWRYFIQALEVAKVHLPKGILIHSGGWKKLEHLKVNNRSFKQQLAAVTGIQQCFNFYGMAEQVGSIFVECQHGHLHCPIFADIVIRDPYTLVACGPGHQGLIQVVSCVPSSYPGHSLLTEDLGTLEGIDDCLCGRKGKYFSVQGRLPKTEVRGCSDTHQTAAL